MTGAPALGSDHTDSCMIGDILRRWQMIDRIRDGPSATRVLIVTAKQDRYDDSGISLQMQLRSLARRCRTLLILQYTGFPTLPTF